MKEQQDPFKKQRGLTDDGQNGQHFGNYDLVRRIDVGGMGEVYLARQRTAFGREVAVKIIRPDLAYDITARKRFLREAEVSAHLKHEHILSLIEFSEHEGRLFLVTPYIKGGTLARRLQSGPLPLVEVYQLFSALVQAVAYIHRRGVIHRDLKPTNILLDQGDENDPVYVRLIDFGIASIPGNVANSSLTMAGHEMGTAAYMAPERLDGIAAPSNDIYSLGVILYQMITGTLPAANKMAPLPEPLETVVRRCILPDPAQRFTNAEELLKAFDRAYMSLSSSYRTQRRVVDESVLPTTPLSDDTPPARRVQTPYSDGSTLQEGVLIHRAEMLIPATPTPGSTFSHEDYSAPTSYIDPTGAQEVHKKLANASVLISQPPYTHPTPKRSLTGLIFIATIALLATISSVSYLVFLSSISANVTITPQVQSVGKVFTITANPALHAIDPGTASIPASVLNSSKVGSKQGPTGENIIGCIPILFQCKRTVTLLDISALVEQLKPGLKDQVSQDLQKQAQTSGCTIVGTPFFNDGNVSSDPAEGMPSDTVTVTLTEQGSAECVKTQDMHTLALTLLQQQVPPNYMLIDQLNQFGQPVKRSVDANGVVKFALAAAGVARYNFSSGELLDIQNHIKSMKLKDAQAYIASRPGLDANASTVHISYGDTLPSNVQQIKVVTVTPTNLPPVQLPAVQ